MSTLTVHGGRLDAAASRFPDAERPWMDLSTGINPVAYPFATLLDTDPRALPLASELASLTRSAAIAFGMPSGSITALPGSEIGLRMLASIGLPSPTRVVVPSYGTHIAAMLDATPIAIDDLARCSAQGGGTILLANPNNPDGRVVSPARLLADARMLGLGGGWLVIDEAFADADPASSILPLLEEDDPVLVFRSFGKFYGLAGIRLGFVCGPGAMVARFRQRVGDWPVSSAAIAIGSAAYADRSWQTKTGQRLPVLAAELDAVLRRHGLEPSGDCPLFRLIETPDAAGIFERLGRAGILTRPFDYAPHWLRFGLPRDADGLDRLDRALGHR